MNTPRADSERAPALHAHLDVLAACRRCADAGHATLGLPVCGAHAGHVAEILSRRQRVMLVGQAPGKVEATGGVPFAGQAGRRLFAWLAEAGIDEHDFRRHAYIAAITRCYPGPAPSGRGDRVASPAERDLCAPWLAQERAIVAPHLVIPVGRLAIDEFAGKVPLAEVVGGPLMVAGTTILPLPHPSGASAWTNSPTNRTKVSSALRWLGDWWHRSR
jgi:uracil-DNA glycosylase